MMFLLLALAGYIAVTGAVVLKRSVELAQGCIDVLRFHIGFVSVYLGLGGVWALFTMSEESLGWCLDYYEVSPQGIVLAAAAWTLVLLSLPLCGRLLPCVVNLRRVDAMVSADSLLRGGVHFLGVVVLAGLLVGYYTGNLGYMGQRVGDSESEYRVSPVFELVMFAFPPMAAWLASRMFDRSAGTLSVLIGACLLAMVVPLGRRVFLAAALAALVISYCRDPLLTGRRTAGLVFIGLLALFAMTVFFNLRQAEENKVGRSLETRTDLIALLPEALALTFSAPDAATKEVAELRRENESRRPFYTLGFLIYCAQGYGASLGNFGMVTLSGLIVPVPSVLLPGKDALLEAYQEEERFIERDFGIPTKLDESPTLPASGLINFGLLGVVMQVFLFAGVTFFCLRLLQFVGSTPFAVLGLAYLVVVSQLAEMGSAALFVRLRFIVILCVLGWLWLALFGIRGKSHADSAPAELET